MKKPFVVMNPEDERKKGRIKEEFILGNIPYIMFSSLSGVISCKIVDLYIYGGGE